MLSDEYKCFENLNDHKVFVFYGVVSVDLMENFIETGPLVFFYDNPDVGMLCLLNFYIPWRIFLRSHKLA